MRTLIRPSLGLCAVLLLANSAAAELKTYPKDGMAVGVVVADQPGKWLIMTVDRQTFFFSFAPAQVFDAGKVCLWEGAPGVYGVVYDAEDGTRETTNVVLGGASPKPPPDPDEPDDPPPPPPIPDGVWKLTRISYDAAATMPDTAKSQLSAVASNYEYIAGEINAGNITTGDAARTKLRTLNWDAVPEDQRAAHGIWNKAVEAVLVEHNDELANSMALIAGAYTAIGKGLKLASEK